MSRADRIGAQVDRLTEIVKHLDSTVKVWEAIYNSGFENGRKSILGEKLKRPSTPAKDRSNSHLKVVR